MRSSRSRTRIYLDYASATPACPEAIAATVEGHALIGNPGALHAEAVEAAEALERARTAIAAELAVKPRDIVFTSGLTEANNLGIIGRAQALDRAGIDLSKTHWIVSSIEHQSVLECFSEIERLGGVVSFIDPVETGVIEPEVCARALRKETVFVSIGWGNNEIGTIQPLSRIARAIHTHEKEHGTTILFHSDAGEAPLYLAPSISTLGVDLFSLGSGKLYGPRGTGALYVGKRADLSAIVVGGGQERGLRAGTESVALVIGFATAFAIVSKERDKESKRLRVLRDEFASALLSAFPDAILNGTLKHALPHMLNVSIPNINAEYLILALDRAGVAVSTKSACAEGNDKRSHAVSVLGGPQWRAENTVRISLGRVTTEADMKRALKIFIDVCARVQKIV